ncbi:MAG TPA: SRPBCC family protein [Steroidobacter sp.]|uniref:SRPBCC family protein n=1 Tax=Steroidobacter sp. TaxID=1978227 RepID=UPI002ED7951A
MHTIERQALLRAPRGRVWNALTDIKKFCEWFGVSPVDGEFKPGAKVRMRAPKEYGGDFDIMVEQMQPEHLFTWRWHPGARDESVDYEKEPTTLVEFKLVETAGGTLLTITESGFDNISLARRARVFGENSQGWEEQLKNLERYVNKTS